MYELVKKGTYTGTIKNLNSLKNIYFSKGRDSKAMEIQSYINILLQMSKLPSEKLKWNETNIRRVAEALSKNYKLRNISYQFAKDRSFVAFLNDGFVFTIYNHPNSNNN